MTDNLTPLRYYQPIPAYVENTPSGQDYVCLVQHGVSLAWVLPQDVDNVLSRRGGCCGKKRQVFSVPGEAIIRVWREGGRV